MFAILAAAAFLTGAADVKTGDLAFRRAGDSDFSRAISSATAKDGEEDFVHVGIIIVGKDYVTNVLEASPEEGVRLTPLEDFCAHGPVVVKRLTVEFPVEDCISRALGHMGEDYDWWYLPDNGKMYCSELVYEAYRFENEEPVFMAKPMNFRAPDGTMPDFWTELFRQLEMEVPEGLPGTNPNDMSADSRLTVVFTTSREPDRLR